MKISDLLKLAPSGDGLTSTVFVGLGIPGTHRAVHSCGRASGGDGLGALQLASPPVTTRNGLARPARIGACTPVDFIPFERVVLLFRRLLLDNQDAWSRPLRYRVSDEAGEDSQAAPQFFGVHQPTRVPPVFDFNKEFLNHKHL